VSPKETFFRKKEDTFPSPGAPEESQESQETAENTRNVRRKKARGVSRTGRPHFFDTDGDLPLFVDADEVELLQSPFRGGVDGLVDGVVRQARATLEGLDDAALHPGLAEVKAGLGLCRRGWWGLGRIFKKGEEPTLFRVSDDDDDDDETGGRKA